MKNTRGQPAEIKAEPAPLKPAFRAKEFARLRARVANAEAALDAIRTGGVDTVVIAGKSGPQVFTLQGAEQAYRVLIESMNEGALTLTADAVILYANDCFARMVKRPLEQVIGSSFRRFLSATDRTTVEPLLQHAAKAGAKIQVTLTARDGSQLPVHLSIRPLDRNGTQSAALGLVVTDMTESRRTEELLRALTHRVVQVQEAERGRVALDLHDHITQPLIAVLFRSQALAARIAVRNQSLKAEAVELSALLGQTAGEVERISRHLRPGVLEQLGLPAVLRSTGAEFADRTGVPVRLDCAPLPERLPADTELALFRILQEALKNVEQHARAHHVTVDLTLPAGFVQLTIRDDGNGFSIHQHAARRKGKGVLGLLAMRERATYVGGTVTVKSGRRAGTEIVVRIPLVHATPAAA